MGNLKVPYKWEAENVGTMQIEIYYNAYHADYEVCVRFVESGHAVDGKSFDKRLSAEISADHLLFRYNKSLWEEMNS